MRQNLSDLALLGPSVAALAATFFPHEIKDISVSFIVTKLATLRLQYASRLHRLHQRTAFIHGFFPFLGGVGIRHDARARLQAQ